MVADISQMAPMSQHWQHDIDWFSVVQRFSNHVRVRFAAVFDPVPRHDSKVTTDFHLRLANSLGSIGKAVLLFDGPDSVTIDRMEIGDRSDPTKCVNTPPGLTGC